MDGLEALEDILFRSAKDGGVVLQTLDTFPMRMQRFAVSAGFPCMYGNDGPKINACWIVFRTRIQIYQNGWRAFPAKGQDNAGNLILKTQAKGTGCEFIAKTQKLSEHGLTA